MLAKLLPERHNLYGNSLDFKLNICKKKNLLNFCRLLLVLKYCCSWTLLKVAQDCCNTERLPTCSNDIINCLLCRIRWPYHSSSASSGFCYLENYFFSPTHFYSISIFSKKSSSCMICVCSIGYQRSE